MPDEASWYMFGPFIFHWRDLVLLKGETRIHLRPQAANLLRFLLEHRFSPASRREIENRLWPAGPPVGIDAGQQINTCIRLIRQALHDRAKAPTYIATVDDGYQFIAPVSSASHEKTCVGCGCSEGALSTNEIPHLEVCDPPARRNSWQYGINFGLFGAIIGALAAFGMAAFTGSYGLAIMACCALCVFTIIIYVRSDDTVYARAMVAALVVSIMAYIPSAATLSQVVSSVVNGTTLKPAIIYPFITGLKFVPLFFCILLEWVFLPSQGSRGLQPHPKLRLGYTLLAAVILLVTATSLIWNSGENRMWFNGLPEFRLIAIGYLIIIVMNAGIWLFGHHELGKHEVASFRVILICLMISYLPVAVAGFIVDQEYNSINLHYLDKRRPDAYRAANPGAIKDFRRASNRLASDIGPDLRNLLSDPSFERALETQIFYKQDFDEMFQIGSRSVMFGFKVNNSSGRLPQFTIIRFPEAMATALRFQSAN